MKEVELCIVVKEETLFLFLVNVHGTTCVKQEYFLLHLTVRHSMVCVAIGTAVQPPPLICSGRRFYKAGGKLIMVRIEPGVQPCKTRCLKMLLVWRPTIKEKNHAYD